jgi:ABC-type proline/glycine betaine transport system permease subunit
MVDNNVILAGAVPAALMALAADLILGAIQRQLTGAHQNRSEASSRVPHA